MLKTGIFCHCRRPLTAVQNINCAAQDSTANLWSTKMTGLRLVVDSTDGKMSYSSLLNNQMIRKETTWNHDKMSIVTCCQNIHIYFFLVLDIKLFDNKIFKWRKRVTHQVTVHKIPGQHMVGYIIHVLFSHICYMLYLTFLCCLPFLPILFLYSYVLWYLMPNSNKWIK